MDKLEYEKLEKAMSVVSEELLPNVLSTYIDSYGLPFEANKENCMVILETAFEIQREDEGISFDEFYDVLTEFINMAIDEELYPDC